MNFELTSKEKNKLLISRIFGAIVALALAAFLVLYYLKLIDGNMFMLAMFGFATLIFLFASLMLSVKSTSFWTGFCVCVAVLFGIAFVAFLSYLFAKGIISF